MLLCLTRSDGPWSLITCQPCAAQHAAEGGTCAGTIILGRKPGPAGVSLTEPTVPSLLSRQHCSVRRVTGGVLEVTDLNSVNGTFYAAPAADGKQHVKRLQPCLPHAVLPGCTLFLGGRDTVLGQHGEPVANPFVFLVCEAADEATNTGACDQQGATTAVLEEGTTGKQRGSPQPPASTRGGDAAVPSQPGHASQHQGLRHEQQQHVALKHLQAGHNTPGVQRPVPYLSVLDDKEQLAGQGYSHARPPQRVLQDCGNDPLPQACGTGSTAHLQGRLHAAAQNLQSAVVGVVEPAAKRQCRRGVSMPPPDKQQQQSWSGLSGPRSQPVPQVRQGHKAPLSVQPQLQEDGAVAAAGAAAAGAPATGAQTTSCTHTDTEDADGLMPGSSQSSDEETCSAEQQDGAPPVVAAPAAADNKQGTTSSRRDLRQISAAHLDCAICRGLLVATHALACGHLFCGPCLAHWLELPAQPSCPSCRTVVTSAPVRMHQIDQLVTEAAASSGSEPQDMAARQELWNGISAVTTASWHDTFGSSAAGKAAAASEQPAGGGGRSRGGARQRGQQRQSDAVHLHSGDRHLLTGLRHPADAGGEGGGGVAAAASTAAGRVSGATADGPRARRRQHGSRQSGSRRAAAGAPAQLQPGAQQQQRIRLLQGQQAVAATGFSRPANRFQRSTPAAPPVADSHGGGQALGPRPLRQTGICDFIN